MARTTETPSQPLVIVVGAGLGGLAAGIAIRLTGRYAVLVLESAAELQEIGAGIQVSPNCTRLLERWGIAKYLEGKAVMPACSRVCRWRDGAILSQARVGEDLRARFGAPYWHVHRADLHSALLRRLEDLGGVLRTASHVVDADPAGDDRGQPSVTLRTGEVLACDFVVGADGLRSKIREAVVVPGFGAVPRATGDYTFRFTVPAEELARDPALAEMAETPITYSWWGPGRHVVAYMLRGGTICNVVAIFPDDGTLGLESRGAGDIDEMKAAFRGWCPRVQSLLDHANPGGLTKWRLMDLSPLPTWKKGRCVLIGDACHPMLPYLAQGAAQAIEDAAALAQCLGRLPDDLEKAAALYTEIRYDRATKIQRFARDQRNRNHMEDGQEQEARDADLQMGTSHSWKWEATEHEEEREWIPGLFEYDAEEVARKILEDRK